MRANKAIAPALLALALAGCGAGSNVAAHQGNGQRAAPQGVHRMPDGTLMSDSEMAMMQPSLVPAKPSSSAAMICSAETHRSLQHNLGLTAQPQSTSRWADGIYTCTYHLAEGELVVSVKDATDLAAGMRYFDSVRAGKSSLHPIGGLQSLGLPGYEDGKGTVLFLKDGKTLDIDATGLQTKVGRYRQPPADVAYGLAAAIIACWSEH